MTQRVKPCFVALSMSLTVATSLCLAAEAAPSDGSTVRIHRALGPLPTDRIIVKYKNGHAPLNRARAQSATQVAANRQGVRFSVLRQLSSGAHLLQLSRHLSPQDAERFADSLRTGDSNVEYAEPDKRLMPTMVPNDAMWSQQWSLMDATGGIRAASAWDRSSGEGVTVAVIDTGVRPHADLVANLLPGYDFIKDVAIAADGGARDADASDPGDGTAAGACGASSAASTSTWHGTHVAGIVAAVAGNGAGIVGVAHGAKVLPLRAMGRCGGYASDVADAIIWAAGGGVAGVPPNTNPARVINLSLGGSGSCDRTSQDAIDAARAKGAVVVVAAGNNNEDALNASPANCSGVITVAATAKSGRKASYSNFGAHVALGAPGGDSDGGIWSTANAGTMEPAGDAYAAYAGTSIAAPMVSGVVALMLSANKDLTADQVLTLLQSTASPYASPCAGCGAGIVDADAAVAAVIGQGPKSPSKPSPASESASKQNAAMADVEPNDSMAQATVISQTPATIAGSLSRPNDNDYYIVSVEPGMSLNVSLTPDPDVGSALGMYREGGQLLRVLSGTPGRAHRLQLRNPGTGPMSVILRVLRSSGRAGAYQLVIQQ